MEKQPIKQSIVLEISPEQFLSSIKEIVEEVINQQTAKAKEAKFYSRKEAAEMLGISVSSICNWLKEGKLKGRKAGSRVVFKESDLHKCLEDWSKYGRVQQ